MRVKFLPQGNNGSLWCSLILLTDYESDAFPTAPHISRENTHHTYTTTGKTPCTVDLTPVLGIQTKLNEEYIAHKKPVLGAPISHILNTNLPLWLREKFIRMVRGSLLTWSIDAARRSTKPEVWYRIILHLKSYFQKVLINEGPD